MLPGRLIRRWTGFLLVAALPLGVLRPGSAAPPWLARLLGGGGALLAALAGLAMLGLGCAMAIRMRSLPILALALLFGAAGVSLAWVYLQRVPW
ncbi:MAG: hypothetical protein U0104_08430 [Gemmatimonadales bacterium]